ncbi:MAG: ATP-binding protein [Chitinophagaceae bacterium]|nr:MAG: ATP-binding protein [Chitinophagaceae bacterium]
MINRALEKEILKELFKKKTILIHGPRRAGKNTLIHNVFIKTNYKWLFLDGDDFDVRNSLESANPDFLNALFKKHNVIFIYEAQQINNIEYLIKTIRKKFPKKQLIINSSVQLDQLNNFIEKNNKHLKTYHLWPLSFEEIQKGEDIQAEELDELLIYGLYPEIHQDDVDKDIILYNQFKQTLYKDILPSAKIRKPDIMHKLIRELANKIGQEINYKQLGSLLNVDAKTISSYIEILEKSFIVFRIPAYSKKQEYEIKKNQKIYFYDNGLRNAVIENFKPLAERKDLKYLWENFLVSERLKLLSNNNTETAKYFWRTKQQQKTDYIEVSAKSMKAYKFEWDPKKKIKASKTFEKTYQTKVLGITRDNFKSFLLRPVSKEKRGLLAILS